MEDTAIQRSKSWAAGFKWPDPFDACRQEWARGRRQRKPWPQDSCCTCQALGIVLHYWSFSLNEYSQLLKLYLESRACGV